MPERGLPASLWFRDGWVFTLWKGEQMQLYEKYRPVKLDDVVGQDKAVGIVRRLMARGLGGRAVWLSGPSGGGKTTLARIMAAEHCGGMEGVVELDCADEVGADQLESIDRALTMRPLWGTLERRCWIINEAHGLRGAAIRRLLGILERMARDKEGRMLLIFTTTKDGQDDLFGNQTDAPPLLSRCDRVPLTNQGLAEAFAVRLHDCLDREGLNGRPIADYVKLMKRPDVKNNLRAAFQLGESGVMIGGAA